MTPLPARISRWSQVEYAIYVAGRVFAKLLAQKPNLFPSKAGPKPVADGESPD